jgi:hypothetical protein
MYCSALVRGGLNEGSGGAVVPPVHPSRGVLASSTKGSLPCPCWQMSSDPCVFSRPIPVGLYKESLMNVKDNNTPEPVSSRKGWRQSRKETMKLTLSAVLLFIALLAAPGAYAQSRIDGEIEVRTRINGAVIATAGRDLELSVGSFRAEKSQVTGSVKVDTRLNGALLVTAGRDAKVHFGDVDLRNSRVNGDLDVTTRLNGAVIATAGRDLDLAVGAVVIENSQVGAITSETIINGALLVTAGRDAVVRVGGVEVR